MYDNLKQELHQELFNNWKDQNFDDTEFDLVFESELHQELFRYYYELWKLFDKDFTPYSKFTEKNEEIANLNNELHRELYS